MLDSSFVSPTCYDSSIMCYTERQILSAPQQKKEVNRGAKFVPEASTGWAVTALQGLVRTLTAPLFPQPAWHCTAVTLQLYLTGAATCCICPCWDLVSWGTEEKKKREGACSCISVASPPISHKLAEQTWSQIYEDLSFKKWNQKFSRVFQCGFWPLTRNASVTGDIFIYHTMCYSNICS